MDPVTRSKVVFIEGKEDTLAKQLSKLIDTAASNNSQTQMALRHSNAGARKHGLGACVRASMM